MVKSSALTRTTIVTRLNNDIYNPDTNHYIPVKFITVRDLLENQDIEKIHELVNKPVGEDQIVKYFKLKI